MATEVKLLPAYKVSRDDCIMYCGTMVVCEAVVFFSVVYTQEVGWTVQSGFTGSVNFLLCWPGYVSLIQCWQFLY